ncbi:MAG: alpha/beta hydrolase [Actinobacteria bacterium]|nr:alpha/beta hydrolase [Actinomycetota bacterium]
MPRSHLGVVDVYGDSYGTFVAQVFASHHPELVHSLVLDGAYPVTGESAWYPTQGAALRNAYTVVCERTNGCGKDSTGTIALLNQVLFKVRAKPISVVAPGADNRMHLVRISPSTLAGVAFGGTYGPTTYREFNAALLASLGGDHLPLGRLVAEYSYQGDAEPVSVYSSGLNIAVSCHDYPQLFDMSEPKAVRKEQYAGSVAAQKSIDPNLYGLFKIAEYLNSGIGEQSLCMPWPIATRNPWKLPGPPDGRYPDIPTLVLSGELDTITTVAEGDLVAAQFARSRHVTMANSTHVTAMGDVNNCASQAMDAIDRYLQAAGYKGLGLRGGSWSASGWGPVVIELSGYQLYQNLAVTGRVRVDFETGAVEVRAKARGRTFEGHWNSFQGGAGAHVQELR